MSKCKHPYYRMVDGELFCSECGEPSPHNATTKADNKSGEIPENKVGKKPEDKSAVRIMEPESKRLSDKPTKNKQKK